MIPNSLRQRGRILLLAVLCLGPWNSAQAQEPASPPWLVGVSLGIPRAYGQSVSAAALVSMHWTHYRPNRLTFDGSLGIMPRHLGEGGLALAVRPALAIPIKFTNDLLLMPVLGGTLGSLSWPRSTGSTVGYHTGLAVMLFEPERFGLRLGVTRHEFRKTSEPIWLFEVGLTRRP